MYLGTYRGVLLENTIFFFMYNLICIVRLAICQVCDSFNCNNAFKTVIMLTVVHIILMMLTTWLLKCAFAALNKRVKYCKTFWLFSFKNYTRLVFILLNFL